ncbi:MAG: ABC transporter ATP-binding protein [Gammaproteobacteria bacterium]|nr:ABC transporter ATP-binding protein [Gammaproteobacteria bacterium]
MEIFNQYRPERPKESSGHRHLMHLKRLGPYFRRYAWVLIGATAALVLTRVLDALVPLLMKTGIDSLADPEIAPNVAWPALAIAGLVLARFGIFVVARRIMRRVAISVTYDLRKRIFGHVQYQGAAFFHRFSTGDLMSRAVNDIGMVRMVVSFAWVNLITFVFTIAAGLYFMIGLSPTLTLFVVLPVPVVAVTGFLLARQMFPNFRNRQEALADVTSFTQENLNGIRTIQAMAQEDHEIERFRDVCSQYARMAYRAMRSMALVTMVLPFLSALSPIIILVYGGFLVLEGEMTLGTFTAFFAYAAMVAAPITMVGMSLSMFTAAAAGTERIFEVLDYEPEIVDSPSGEIPDTIAGRVEIKGLTFSYPGTTRPAIDDVSITVAPGETIALLGRVGCGKSTLLHAIVRLVDTPRGSIFIDGIDICDYPLQRLRHAATLVPQDPFLFSATIAQNLAYDDPSRDVSLLWDAAEAGGLAATIREFPDGMETVVGERGMTLSGGQKQRATLARGLVRNAPILLLDDCFSSVDTETEERILSGLARLREGRTTLLISHRVSTARHADRIYVLDDGHVRESGSHEELLALGGYYAALEAVQSDQERDRARKMRLLNDLDVDVAKAVGS